MRDAGSMNLLPHALLGHTKAEGTVRIQRPTGEVFEFYRDFTNLPKFLGDVMSIDSTGEKTSRWTIHGPLGRKVQWDAEVITEERNSLIRYQTTSFRGLKTTWNIHFSAAGDGVSDSTDVREVMEVPLGGAGMKALALFGHPPNEEIAANLVRLKQLMETGRVTETRHAVPGKFDGAASS